jgi:hypothetical protein
MPWRVISSAQIKGKFSPAELVSLKQIQGSDTDAALELLTSERLPDAIRAFIGAMAAAGYDVVNDDTIPDQLRQHAMAMAVWNWLSDFPRLVLMMTDARKKAADDAQKALESIAKREMAIEAPVTDPPQETTGNWNAERRLIMRTHPTPTSAEQFPASPDYYANPDAPQDT